MWILESDGDFLQGRRMWLKPGKKYLFGRVKRDGVRFAIDHKTISRKHFIVEVGSVHPGDASHIHTRSKITITDQKSKHGTHVDGKLLQGKSAELSKSEHSLRPGTCPFELTIKWVPCVLTFQLTKKEVNQDVLRSKCARLEELDIKAILEYSTEHTTHVVANKRNTVKGLQALIEAKYLVADSYIDALVYATTPADLAEDENLSPLEEDFDSAWPKPQDHLPPPSKEPTVRPVEAYEPDLERRKIFETLVFVFGDQAQHDTLLPAITCGHGKALLFKVDNGRTTVDETVRFMRNAAGEKGTANNSGSDSPSGAIMVRWTRDDDYGEWTQNLINEVALQLDQRAVDQSEFLEAILAKDPYLLRQPIPFESTVDGRVAPPPSAASFATIRETSSQQIPARADNNVTAAGSIARRGPCLLALVGAEELQSATSSATEPREEPQTDQPAPPPKRTRIRTAPVSRFKNFDDGFDADSIPLYSGHEFPQSQIDDSQPVENTSTQVLIKDEPLSATPMKRRHPSPSSSDSGNDMMSDLLPAATAMKRRKIEMENEAGRQGQPGGASSRLAMAPPALKPKKKVAKAMDVREDLRAHREAADAAEERERETLADGLDPEDKAPARLAVVAEFKLPVRNSTSLRRANGEESERWDVKWNGRKNFKKFRKQGEAGGTVRRHAHKVIVPLIEVKRNTYGLGEQYWDKTDSQKKKRKEGGRSQIQPQTETQTQTQTQTQARSQTAAGSDAEESGSEAGDTTVMNISPEASHLRQEAVEILGESSSIDPDSPRRTRQADKTEQAARGTKRPASKAASRGLAAKKQKTIPTIRDSDSDSDDLKFRFGRGRRKK